VDDNATNRRILVEMLSHWRMAASAAEGGRSALMAMGRARDAGRPFALVLLDAQMPDMDGFAVAEQIRRTPELAGATIMMLTSNRQIGDVARCRELGISVFLTKPITQSELLDAILLALGQGPQASKPAEAVASPPCAAVRSMSILLAEDNPINQSFVVRLLEKRGHKVVVTNSGFELHYFAGVDQIKQGEALVSPSFSLNKKISGPSSFKQLNGGLTKNRLPLSRLLGARLQAGLSAHPCSSVAALLPGLRGTRALPPFVSI
jgi:CheY-like chemotaxis protein